MNIHQTNRSNMIESVLSYLALHVSIISGSTGLSESIAKLKTLIEAIWVKDNEKKGATTGKVDKKRNSQSVLEKQTLHIAAALFLWGKKNNDMEIKKLAELKKSDFGKLRDADKINKAKAIYNAATGKDLSFAKVAEADITKLNDIANEYKNDIANVSTAASKRIAAGQTLDQMLDEAVNLLKEEIDKYLIQFEDESPEFYAGYKAARVIWDKGGKQNNNGTVQTTIRPI